MHKVTEHVGTQLPLMEAFYTIQGEGFHSGKAAYFIRLGGCDVGCHWCDVKESWDVSAFKEEKVADIVTQAKNFPARIAVVTGGEPLMHPLEPLCKELHREGFQAHLETSGAYQLTGSWDWICFSPKKFKKPLPEIYQRANELKIVIYNQSDFQWAESFAPLMGNHCQLFLQPEWSVAEKMVPTLVDYVKKFPHWGISLQTHKYMNVP
ncbi:MAG: 7-carboxy-7-deazaguanine synthase QueE [Cyclobacteriaceae bacterium]